MSVLEPAPVAKLDDHNQDIWDSICDLESSSDFRDRTETKLITMAKAVASAEKYTDRKRNHVNIEVMAILATGGINLAHMDALFREIPITRAQIVHELNAQTDKLKSFARAVEKMRRDLAEMEDTTPNRRDLEAAIQEIEGELQVMMGGQWCNRHLKPRRNNTRLGRLGALASESMPAWF